MQQENVAHKMEAYSLILEFVRNFGTKDELSLPRSRNETGELLSAFHHIFMFPLLAAKFGDRVSHSKFDAMKIRDVLVC